MAIKVKIIEDSISNHGVRLTTMQLMYPRFIHAEFMTHRMFSRNASSSRAIPTKKMIEDLKSNYVMPEFWGENQAGMQANNELPIDKTDLAMCIWIDAVTQAIEYAEMMAGLNVHKQIVNRILEPFSHINVVVTATEWDNFFDLRCHKDAQPEIQKLAMKMRDNLNAGNPAYRDISSDNPHDWHLPYISDDERNNYEICILNKVSAARCARVSYLKHDGQNPDIQEDLKLFEKLAASKPIHASPLEHQAHPLFNDAWCKNFRGWRMFRDVIEKQGN